MSEAVHPSDDPFTDEEREAFEYLASEHPDTDAGKVAQVVLQSLEDEESEESTS